MKDIIAILVIAASILLLGMDARKQDDDDHLTGAGGNA